MSISSQVVRYAILKKYVSVSGLKWSIKKFPKVEEVYLGREIKGSYLHSLWIGIGMTVIHLPVVIGKVVLLPLGLALIGAGAVILQSLTRMWRGITWSAAGIAVDEKSFDLEMHRTATESAKRNIVRTDNILKSIVNSKMESDRT